MTQKQKDHPANFLFLVSKIISASDAIFSSVPGGLINSSTGFLYTLDYIICSVLVHRKLYTNYRAWGPGLYNTPHGSRLWKQETINPTHVNEGGLSTILATLNASLYMSWKPSKYDDCLGIDSTCPDNPRWYWKKSSSNEKEFFEYLYPVVIGRSSR